ncbi:MULTISPECIES: NUDIX hydrolase [Brevibacterium]|uniref:NUDIX hydrolase n=1 Tax=Brevibacterium casei TaxID=33889 RepID=A0A7T4A055_9MICO|nr:MULTISPECIES: NUDIX hydrolase [Brevibacterium]QQB14832.1 NUDIX hydrolase [Brevibacterium casei]
MTVDPTAVPIRPAVSVIMVRDGESGLEVFVQHRVSTMDFAAGVVVFPGGRVDPVDVAGAEAVIVSDPELHRAAWQDSTIDDWRVLIATAVREVAEETGAVIDPNALTPWANWVTPLGQPKRFDTYFYVMAADDALAPQHVTTEAHTSEWLSVAALLAAESAGELKLMRPTFVLLSELATFASAAAVTAGPRAIDVVRPDEAR